MIIHVFFPLVKKKIEFVQFHRFKHRKMSKVTSKPCCINRLWWMNRLAGLVLMCEARPRTLTGSDIEPL